MGIPHEVWDTDTIRERCPYLDPGLYGQLQGYRGKPAANLTALVKTVRALADFAESHSERLLELDVNPLLVTPTGCIAVDVMLRETLG